MDKLHATFSDFHIMTNVYLLSIYKAHKLNAYHPARQQHLPARQEEMSESESPFCQTECLVVTVSLVILMSNHFLFEH